VYVFLHLFWYYSHFYYVYCQSMSMGDLSIFCRIPRSLSSVVCSSPCRGHFIFVKFVPRYLSFLEAIVNEIAFLYSFSIFSSLMYKKATDICKLVFVSCYTAEAVYLIFVPYSPSYTLSIYPPLSHWYQSPRLEWKWEH
jgi:hypothetical protein